MTWRFLVLAGLFVTCLLTANVIATKLVVIGGLILPAGVVIFPISYIVGDVLTEVYGYAAARRVICPFSSSSFGSDELVHPNAFHSDQRRASIIRETMVDGALVRVFDGYWGALTRTGNVSLRHEGV